MKLRKIISAAMAAAVILVSSAASVCAVADGEATYCFDTDAALSEWKTFGSVEATGFSYSVQKIISQNGNGSLIVSEKVQDEVSEKFGGAYVEASTFGLNDFSGCTAEMSVRLCERGNNHYDSLTLYSDGMILLSVPVTNLSEKEWTSVTLQIPENAENNMIGFSIPTYGVFIGDIVYIDDLVIRDADGKVITNRGDYELKKITGDLVVSKGTNIALTIVLVVLIIGIIAGIGVFVASSMKRFH